LRQPGPDLRLVLEAVDDDGDVMFDSSIELQVLGQANHLIVHAGADKTALEHVLEQVLVFAFLAADDRGQDEETRSLRQGQNPGDDLLAGLRRNWPPTLRTMTLADAGIEHPEVIIDLGDR